MKKIFFPLLFLLMLSIPAMSQFASSKHKNDRGDFEFARTSYGNPMFDNKGIAQVNDEGTFKVGAYVGFLLSRLREKDFDPANRAAVIFGGQASYQYTQTVFFMTGLLIALNGTRFDFNGSNDYGFNLTTLVIPLLVGYAVMPELMVFAGVQLGFILSAKDTDGENLNDFFKGMDFGIKFGAAYQITELIMAQIAYTLGVSNVADSDDNVDLKSGMFEVGVGYRLFQQN